MSSDTGNEHAGLRNLGESSSEDVARYYDEWAANYDAQLAEWGYEAPEQVAERLRARLSPAAEILDVGCGTGLSGRALVNAGFSTIDGNDVSRRSLEIAERLGVYRDLQAVDLDDLPLPGATDAYDGLVCVGVLTYVSDTEAVMREFCRVLRPGGTMVLTQRSDLMEPRDFPGLLRRLEDEGLLRDSAVSGRMPYLPYNEEFGRDVDVHYVVATVG